jgi:DNA-binding CsgD family transcriptional regulator
MGSTAVLNGLGDLVFVLDREQRVKAVYGRYIQNGTYQSAHFLDKLMADEWPADVGAIHCEMNARALDGQTVVYDWEFPVRGTGRRMITTILPVFSEHSRAAIRLLRISSDLKEHRAIATHAVQSAATSAPPAHEVGVAGARIPSSSEGRWESQTEDGRGSEEMKAVLFRLSARERVIARHLLDSSRTSQIARDLKISVHTTRQHLKNIFRKAGVHSQRELLDLLRHGRQSISGPRANKPATAKSRKRRSKLR